LVQQPRRQFALSGRGQLHSGLRADLDEQFDWPGSFHHFHLHERWRQTPALPLPPVAERGVAQALLSCESGSG